MSERMSEHMSEREVMRPPVQRRPPGGASPPGGAQAETVFGGAEHPPTLPRGAQAETVFGGAEHPPTLPGGAQARAESGGEAPPPARIGGCGGAGHPQRLPAAGTDPRVPATGPGSQLARTPGYPELIAALVAIQDAEARQEATVHAWHAQTLAASRQGVEEATGALAEAEEEVTRAQEAVARIDYAARRLWGDLGNRLSWRAAKRRGPVPAPAPDGTPGEQADQLISQARGRLAAAPVVQVLAPWAYPLMVLLAAGCGTAVARLAHAMTGPPWARLAALAAAPLLGLVPARLVARAQHSGLDAWSIAVTLLAAAVTAVLVFFLTR